MNRKRERMPDIFHDLATYHCEVDRGIMHTPEWQARMAALQEQFNEWDRRQP